MPGEQAHRQGGSPYNAGDALDCLRIVQLEMGKAPTGPGGILPDLREQITCFLPVTVGIIHPQKFLGIQNFFLSVKQFAPDIFPPLQHGLE